MKPVTVINRFAIKPGKIDQFVESQRKFAAELPDCGLIGGRMYRSADGLSAVLVSTFKSNDAQEKLRQRPDFQEHIGKLQDFIDSSTPALYENAYTTGVFE